MRPTPVLRVSLSHLCALRLLCVIAAMAVLYSSSCYFLQLRAKTAFDVVLEDLGSGDEYLGSMGRIPGLWG